MATTVTSSRTCSNCIHSFDNKSIWDCPEACTKCQDTPSGYSNWTPIKLSPPKNLGDLLRARLSNDNVNHPDHYTKHPSGIEAIQVTEHMNFCLGNAVKYIWRAGLKAKDPIEDLSKAKWYLEREIGRLKGTKREV